LVDTSRDLIPDAPKINVYGFRPEVNLPLEPFGPEVVIDDDDAVVVGLAPMT
jgi:hypothetical protein